MPSVERVYCLPAEALPEASESVLPISAELYRRVASAGEFLPRAAVEEDPSWRQIIPYAVIWRSRQVFLVERLSGGSERRLHQRLSIGLGGHVEPGSHPNARDVIEGALVRELNEELVIGAFRSQVVGLIHSDRTKVDSVHTGVLYRVEVLGDVRVREQEKLRGSFVSWDAVMRRFERLETWSQLAADVLAPAQGGSAPAHM